MQDEVIYRCIHAACARPMPRRVNFCPYCGTAQRPGLVRPERAAVREPAPVSIEPPRQRAPPPPPPPPPPRPAAAATASVAPDGPRPAPRAAAPAPPPLRKPVRLRYWLLALAVLWLIWVIEKPDTRKINARIDAAVAMALACRSAEAQSELIALRATRATPEQLVRLQTALNQAAPACDRKRAKAAPKASRPLARQHAQSVRNLIAEAERDMARSDYRAASDKMETCAAMVDTGSRECSALKAKADRLLGEMQRCVAGGRNWIGERCEN